MKPASRPMSVPVLEQINSEVFTLTYGSIVRQILADFEDIEEVNKQLETMGYNIGIRLIDEFLAKSKVGRCTSFKETAEVVAKQGLQLFLNIQANVTKWNDDGTRCSLVLTENPLADFVELPEEYKDLKYSNILCGVIRGALEMVNFDVECKFVRDVLRGDDEYEIEMNLKEQKEEKYPFKDDD